MIPGYDDSLTRELGPNERLLWNGGPQGGIRLRPADAYLIPFSLFWGGFAFFWEYNVVHIPSKAGGPGLFMQVWGIPFVLMGLYLIVGRFFADAYLRARTSYGVTNQRVLIVAQLRNRQVKAIALRTLSEVSLQERSDGSGSITFGPTPVGLSVQPGWPGARQKAVPSFEFVKEVRGVFDLIKRSQDDAADRQR